MRPGANWQRKLLEELSAELRADGDVRSVAARGSLADEGATPDAWSDIDIRAVVAEEAVARLCGRAWLERFGEVLGMERHEGPEETTLRVCFAPCRRVDLTLVTEAQTKRTPTVPRDTDDGVAGIREPFCFRAAVAIAKTMRNDLLVAQHLALDLARDCLVLQMVRRDRALGTNAHRSGGFGNELVTRLMPAPDADPRLAILAQIERAIEAFDALGDALGAEPRPQARLMLPALRQAQAACRETPR